MPKFKIIKNRTVSYEAEIFFPTALEAEAWADDMDVCLMHEIDGYEDTVSVRQVRT